MTYLEKIVELVKSRKFQVAISAAGTALVTGISASQPWYLIAALSLAPVIAWVFAQSNVDASKVAAIVSEVAGKVDESAKALTDEQAKALATKAMNDVLEAMKASANKEVK